MIRKLKRKRLKIFISQSGYLSRIIADIFRRWITDLIWDVDIFVSSSNINNGETWFQKIVKSMKESKFAISIITKENHGSPWINYEYGALAMLLKDKLVPILLGVKINELNEQPIQQYQCVISLNKAKLKKMFLDINELNEYCKRNVTDLINDFFVTYEKYEHKINSYINRTSIKKEALL
jgi:hypothetical protein